MLHVDCAAILCLGALLLSSTFAQECSRFEYDRCVQTADPLVREPHLVFPDNMDDIALVCRTWTQFVDCLKSYTERCFTDQQRRQFNKAVEHPIESVHQMCMQPHYQREYLQYAPCIKSTIIERHRCGPHYGLLVDQVAQGEIISKATLCCSHDRFKQCVQREARHLCDGDAPNGPASSFAVQILDKALSFLQEQCFNYIPNSGDCAPVSSSTNGVHLSTAASDIYPWSTQNSRQLPTDGDTSTHTPKHSTGWQLAPSISTAMESASGILGSRTRPASYGRSGSWSDANGGSSSTTSPAPSVSRASTARTTEAWKPGAIETTSSASVEQQHFFATHQNAAGTETWYPAAGNQLSNEVDEPNQQGLKYNKNASIVGRLPMTACALLFAAILSAILM